MYQVHPANTTTGEQFGREPGSQFHSRPVETGDAVETCCVTQVIAPSRPRGRRVADKATMDGLSKLRPLLWLASSPRLPEAITS